MLDSAIDMQPGQSYTVRGGFYIQTSDSIVTGQTIGFDKEIEITLAGEAMQGLAAGIVGFTASLFF